MINFLADCVLVATKGFLGLVLIAMFLKISSALIEWTLRKITMRSESGGME